MMGDYGLPGYRGDLNQNCVTIAEALKPAGYSTLMSGKWHVTPANESKHNWPMQRGFDRFYGTIHGAGSFYDPVTLTRGNDPIEPEGSNFYYTTAIGENAAKFIEDAAGGDAPFFLYVPFTAPHWPLHAFDRDIAEYQRRYDAGWDALREERHKRMIQAGIVDSRWPLTRRDAEVPAWEEEENKAWQARRMEVYAAQVDVMDRAVGTIVDKLSGLGLLDNTLILFLADNGGCAEELAPRGRGLHFSAKTRDGLRVRLGNNPKVMPGPPDTYQSYGIPWANASNTPFRRYKHWVHEGGIASPLIAHWPARITRRNELTHERAHLIDIMATCVDAAGAEYPSEFNGNAITPLEGKSLLPVLEGGQRAGHDALYWEHEGNRAVRQGNWKLVSQFSNRNRWELYDLEADRTEIKNLIDDQSTKAEELIALYDAWAGRAQVAPWRSWE
jgi:arylsulfatase